MKNVPTFEMINHTRRKKKTKMFSFITDTWNPIAMNPCWHRCKYCWSEGLKAGKLKDCARYKQAFQCNDGVKLIESEFKKHFKDDDFVFVEDMGDLFGEWVPQDWIDRVTVTMGLQGNNARFLVLTKNPRKMVKDFGSFVVPMTNVTYGVTIETNRSTRKFSMAPDSIERVVQMHKLLRYDCNRFVCIEPIMDFDLAEMMAFIADIRPQTVAVGYDNYKNKLPEPPLWKTLELINSIEFLDIQVEKKTLREPWNHEKV